MTIDDKPTRKPTGRKRVLVIAGVVAMGLGAAALLVGLIGDRADWFGGLAWLWQLGLAWLATGGVWLVCAWRISDEPIRPAGKRYLQRLFSAIAAYVVLLVAVLLALHHVDPPWLRALLALLPVAPVGWILWAMYRLVLGSDELERLQQLQAIALAAMAVGLLSFAGAFLQIAGVLQVTGLLMWVLPALFAFYGLAMLWIRNRYQGA